MQAGGSKAHQIRGNQFPFGVFNLSSLDDKKIYVKKRYFFRSQEEYQELRVKIDKLKTISHKNTINLRSAEENSYYIDLFYQYIPYSLDDSFAENPTQTVKEMHRQFIELAIYLAKNCILTTFNPNRCGVVINEAKSTLKYYLPLPEITVTNSREALERSVNLFNVQSMHYLDTLAQQGLNTTINEISSQRTFKNRVKLFPSQKDKHRRDSQPTGFQSKERKMSNHLNKQEQIRKLSTLSRELSQISQMHKRHRASTRVSGGSFNTFKSILSLKSNQETNIREKSNEQSQKGGMSLLRRCLSQNGTYDQPYKIDGLVARSKQALNNLKSLREKMSSYKGLFNFIKTLHPEY